MRYKHIVAISALKVCGVCMSKPGGGLRTSKLMKLATALCSLVSSLPGSCVDPDPEQEPEHVSWQLVGGKKPSLELVGEAGLLRPG